MAGRWLPLLLILAPVVLAGNAEADGELLPLSEEEIAKGLSPQVAPCPLLLPMAAAHGCCPWLLHGCC